MLANFPLLLALTSPAWILLPVVTAQSNSTSTCLNYGQDGGGGNCQCPAGFTEANSNNCNLPQCGGSLYAPGSVAPTQYGNVSSCSCSDGWGGPSCGVCTSSDACNAAVKKFLDSNSGLSNAALNTSVTCSQVPTVYSVGHLSCSVVQPTLQTLYPLASTLTISRFLNTSLVPGGAASLDSSNIAHGDGQVWAQLWYAGVEQFYCHGTECKQTTSEGPSGSANSSQWVCSGLECTCRPGVDFCGGSTTGALNLGSVISTLKPPLTINCAGDGKCQFQQQFLNQFFGQDGLTLTNCRFGECTQQYVIDQAEGVSAAVESGGNSLSGGVIAGLAVVGAFLVAIIAIIIWGLIVRSKARKEPLDNLKDEGGVGVAWSGVTYEVRPHGRGLYAGVVSWLRGFNTPPRPKAESETGSNVGPNGGRIVLRDSCGEVPPGGFCVILGPSGAGKSTLIDILGGKRKSGHVEGRVTYLPETGQPRSHIKIGFVDQSDVLSPTSTVLETLMFAANLRLPENVPSEVKERRAREVMTQLGLDHIADTRVGSGEHRGISGGEARRVSIGIELVAAPDVLVLDEPTSGLDSVSAARLVALLKSLTEGTGQRTSIIASIHQPSSSLYHSFSQVLLLADGRQLYFGPGGSKPAEFFAAQGYPCPAGYNVADHLLDIASESPDQLRSGTNALVRGMEPGHQSSNDGSHSEEAIEGKESNSNNTGPDSRLNEKYESTGQSPNLGRITSHEVDLSRLKDSTKTRSWWPQSYCATTFLTQVQVLGGREMRNLRRDKTLLIAHVALASVVGVFAGGLYYNVNLTIAGFQNRVGSLFFLGSLIAFSSLSALFNLVEVRPLFLRERAGNFYSAQAWLLSRVLWDVIPLRLVPTIILSVIVYFMVGLARTPARFFKYLLILIEFSLSMTVFNFLLACVFSHGGVAILLSSLCNLFLMTYAGFFVNMNQIPPVLRWLRWFSTLGYTLEALTINEVGSGLQIVDTLSGVPINISAVLIMQTLFGFGLSHYYRDVLVLFAFIAGFIVLLVFWVVYFLRETR